MTNISLFQPFILSFLSNITYLTWCCAMFAWYRGEKRTVKMASTMWSGKALKLGYTGKWQQRSFVLLADGKLKYKYEGPDSSVDKGKFFQLSGTSVVSSVAPGSQIAMNAVKSGSVAVQRGIQKNTAMITCEFKDGIFVQQQKERTAYLEFASEAELSAFVQATTKVIDAIKSGVALAPPPQAAVPVSGPPGVMGGAPPMAASAQSAQQQQMAAGGMQMGDMLQQLQQLGGMDQAQQLQQLQQIAQQTNSQPRQVTPAQLQQLQQLAQQTGGQPRQVTPEQLQQLQQLGGMNQAQQIQQLQHMQQQMQGMQGMGMGMGQAQGQAMPMGIQINAPGMTQEMGQELQQRLQQYVTELMTSPNAPQAHELQQLVSVKANEIATVMVQDAKLRQVGSQAAQSIGQQNQQAQLQALIDGQAQASGFQAGPGQIIPAMPNPAQATAAQQSQVMGLQQAQQQGGNMSREELRQIFPLVPVPHRTSLEDPQASDSQYAYYQDLGCARSLNGEWQLTQPQREVVQLTVSQKLQGLDLPPAEMQARAQEIVDDLVGLNDIGEGIGRTTKALEAHVPAGTYGLILVAWPMAGSLAQMNGLRAYDVLIAINGQTFDASTTVADVTAMRVASLKKSKTVELRLFNIPDQKVREVTIKLLPGQDVQSPFGMAQTWIPYRDDREAW
eukprot:m.358850 g.358850  ORF g.358850 m.358850 type:complete len:671 (-) comp18320_c0_seq1:471-2483(-)